MCTVGTWCAHTSHMGLASWILQCPCAGFIFCVCSRESGSAFLVPNKGRLRFRSVSVPRLHSRCAKVVMERTRKKPLTPCSFHSRSTAASTLPPFLHLLLPPHSCPHFFAQKKSPSTCRRQKGDASDMNHMCCFSWFLCVFVHMWILHASNRTHHPRRATPRRFGFTAS